MADPPQYAGDPPEPVSRTANGILLWFVAAGALIIGIVIGFTSGYSAGQRRAPASEGQTFSEAAVVEPVRVDPPPIVVPDEPPPPEPAPVRAAAPEPSRAAAPAPAPQPRTPVVEPRAPAVTPTSTAPGSIEVLSRPSGAQVILDGRVIGRTPLSIPNVAGGTHTVRIELAGFNRWATSVDVTPGMRARVAASLEQ